MLATAVQAELQGGSPKPSGENNKDALKEEVRRKKGVLLISTQFHLFEMKQHMCDNILNIFLTCMNMDTKHCVGSLLLGNVKPLHFSDYF